MQRARYNTELLQPNFLKLTLSNLLGSFQDKAFFYFISYPAVYPALMLH